MADKTDLSGLVKSLRAAGKRAYLGDLKIVEQYVREFAVDVLSNCSEVGEGTIEQDMAVAAAEEACREGGHVFAGLVAGYSPMAGWNGKGLADEFRGIGLEGGDDAEVIAEAFRALVHRIYGYLGDAEDEEAVQKSVMEDVRAFAMTLIGTEDPEWLAL